MSVGSRPGAAAAPAPGLAPRDALLLGLVLVGWALNFVVAKLALQELPPLLLTALRFTVVAAVLLPFAPRPQKLGRVAIIALTLGVLHFSTMFTALASGAPVASIAVTAQLNVPFSAVLAAFFLNDRLGPWRIVGMVIGLAGVAIMSFDPAVAAHVAALALAVLAAFFWAVGNVQSKAFGFTDAVALNAWMGVFVAPAMLLLSFLFEPAPLHALAEAGWRGWGGVVYMGVVVTAFGYGVWFALVRRYSVNVVTPASLLVPPMAAILAWMLLSEPLTPRLVLGGLVTLAGVAVVVIRRPQWGERSA
jgi:O-acetylserine/cysteine efflux transporter